MLPSRSNRTIPSKGMTMSTMERRGCFVFLVESDEAVPVRSQPSSKDEAVTTTGTSFAPGDLISIDLIRTVDAKTSLLRLTDGSGWILQQEDNVRQLFVESDIYVLVVDHFPAGISARNNPNEGDQFRVEDVSFRPLEKVYCDKRVIHPETACMFYRLQGTNYWVFDRKFDQERKTFDPTLLEDYHVTFGTFAFMALSTVSIRSIPTLNQQFKTGLDIHKGELIMVNVVRDSPQGPWLRLACGTGWVPEASGRRSYFEQVVMENSIWSFRILNHPIGIQLRAHPLDERDEKLVNTKSFEDRQQIEFPKLPVLIEPDNIVECDMRITSPVSGVNWYHVVDSKGWIFDRRNGKATVEPFKINSRRLQMLTSTWTIELLRGMAAMIDGLDEIRHNDADHVALFQKGELQLKIWYKTRTVTVYVDRPNHGRVQASRKDCSKEDLVQIMKNPKHLLSDSPDQRHPTSPRSAAEFDRQSWNDDAEAKGPKSHSPPQKKTALMKYGARYHRPHVSTMQSTDESQVAIKGIGQDGRSSRSVDSDLVVRVPSNLTAGGTIASRRERARHGKRHQSEPPRVMSDLEDLSAEDEIESRYDLQVLEKEILLLQSERQSLVEGLLRCQHRRSDEAHQLQLQNEGVLRKLDPLVEPGLVFWGPSFGTWKCDKCKEICTDRHSLTQHVTATGH